MTRNFWIVVEVPRHQRIQAHGEGAAIAVALGPAFDVSYLRVGAQRNFLIQSRKSHVVKEPRSARNAREIPGIVELQLRSARLNEVIGRMQHREKTHMCEDQLYQVQRKFLCLRSIRMRACGRRKPGMHWRGDGVVLWY
jgi:hypothetical protein